MYALISNGVVEKYPYSIGDLRRDNPQTSFPTNPSMETLAEYGVFPVQSAKQPDSVYTKNVTENHPQLVNGAWVQTWLVEDASAEEVQQRTNDKVASVRAERNSLIADCDWTQLNDSPLTSTQKQAWAVYRQSLRDITTQSGFPWNVVWPNKP